MITDESKIFEKMYGQKVLSADLNIDGFDEKIPFDIYDGYAVCEDYKGSRYDMVYPTLKAIKELKELYEAVIEETEDITTKEEINVIHVLSTFNTLYKDGVEVIAA